MSGARVDVAILGAGVAGLAAAYQLRDLDIEVLEAEDAVGGRTRSDRFSRDCWANYGAQYVSEDKTRIVELAREVGVSLVPSAWGTHEERLGKGVGPEAAAEVASQIKRLESEQANVRPLVAWELDDRTFADWLSPCSEDAAGFWEQWCGSLLCSSIVEVSLGGVMWFWGSQRTSPWAVEKVETSGLGHTVIHGGTNELTKGLAHTLGERVSLGTRVLRVAQERDGYLVECTDHMSRPRRLHARQVVSALPAPVAASVLPELPGWKLRALSSVRYGRFLSTPIVISPRAEQVGRPSEQPTRPGQAYNSNGFALRTPGDIEKDGGCYHSYVYDSLARQIWDDHDDSVKSGAVRQLLRAYPQYQRRVKWVGIRRWLYGLPQFVPGQMKQLPALEMPIGGISFCGDYCMPPNMEGAARHADRAAAEVLSRHNAARRASPGVSTTPSPVR